MATTNMTIKLLIDTEAKKILFAEASKEFVDFLFFLLALPIGTVIKLLTSESMVGSIGNLFTSFANLNETYLAPNLQKNDLLNPFVFSSSTPTNTPLFTSQSSIVNFGHFYDCLKCHYKICITNMPNGASCINCHQKMIRCIKFVAASENGMSPSSDNVVSQGYVKQMVPYLVFDDLSVKPMSTMSIVSMMNKSDISKLEERKVIIGTKEALELLKISFQSTTVLTDVFLGSKHGKDFEELSAQFSEEIEEKIEELQSMEKLNQALITREHMSNEELQDARKELINVFQTLPDGSDVGIKRMGEIDQSPFKSACIRKFGSEKDCIFKSLELVSLWQSTIMESNWHPFKMIPKEGNHQEMQEVVDEDDSKLKELRNEWGDGVYNAVVKALMEVNEYNPSGQYVVQELWNFKEGKKATIKEAIQCLSDQLNIPESSKRRRMA